MQYSYSLVTIVALIAALYLTTSLVRYLFLSPLRKIPGPSVAAFTGIWLWLHDLRGTAPGVIKDLHNKYGRIVRIGPNELSVDDPNVHNTVLYCQAPKFMKANYFYEPFATGPPGIFQTTSAIEHSKFRRLVSRPYSRKSILEFEPQIRGSTEALVEILSRLSTENESFCLSKMARCLSLDFITSFVYGESMGAIKSPQFHHDVLDAFDSFAVSNFLFMMLPSLRRPSIAFLSALPLKVFKAIPRMRNQVKAALEWNKYNQKKLGQNEFEPLLQSEIRASIAQNQPLSEDFFIGDGVANIFAGTDTTSVALTLTLLEIFCNDTIYARLHDELKEAIPQKSGLIDLAELEALPYLTACVKEGLRFSTPVRSRLPRVVPSTGWAYQGHTIPGGTFISSSPYLMNYNSDVFPQPEIYNPDRWLSTDLAELKALDSTVATFSKGSRGCIGINLATSEIYIAIATIIRRFKLGNRPDRKLQVREIFGVIFDKPVTVVLHKVED